MYTHQSSGITKRARTRGRDTKRRERERENEGEREEREGGHKEERKRRLERDRTRCFATHGAPYARGVDGVRVYVCVGARSSYMRGAFAWNGSGRARLLALLNED